MKLNQIRLNELTPDIIVSNKYDLVVCSTGFEDRSTYCHQKYQFDGAVKWAPGFVDRNELRYINNEEYFKTAGFDTAAIDDRVFAHEFLTRLDQFQNNGKETHVLIDVSSMSRSRMAEIVDAIRRATHAESILVDIVYSVAVYSPPDDNIHPISICEPVTPSFAGWTGDTKRSISSIFGLGYELDLVIGVIEYLEVGDVSVFVPHGPDERYLKDVVNSNSVLWEFVADYRRFEYDVLDPISTFMAIESLVYGLSRNSRVMLVPLGPKIFSFLCLLVAAVHAPLASVWRVSSGHFGPAINRIGSDSIAMFRLTKISSAEEEQCI